MSDPHVVWFAPPLSTSEFREAFFTVWEIQDRLETTNTIGENRELSVKLKNNLSYSGLSENETYCQGKSGAVS